MKNFSNFKFYKAFRMFLRVTVCAFILFSISKSELIAQTISYSEYFTVGMSYHAGSPQFDHWNSFRASLGSGTFTSLTIKGSNDATGVSVTNPTIAAQIASALYTGRAGVWTSDGRTWAVGLGCSIYGSGVVELSANGDNCACSNGYIIRPQIENENWGGVNGRTCNAVSQQITVVFNDIATSTIIASGSLSAFSACSGTASSSQSFSVAGTNLATDINVSAPVGYEVSTSSAYGYAGSLTLYQSGGNVPSTTIYIRLTSTASGSPSGNVTLTSSNAATIYVSASGTVTPVSLGGSITGTSTITYGSSTGTMTLSGYTGVIQEWQKKSATGSWSNISNTAYTYSETPDAAGVWYFRAFVKNGGCDEANSDEFSVTVNKKELTIGITANNKDYDGNRNALTYASITSGLVPGDDITVSSTNGLFDTKDQGIAKDVTADVSITGGADAANYSSNLTATAKANIQAVQLIPFIIAEDKIYDGGTTAILSSQYVTGMVNGETAVNLVVTASNFDTKDIGINKTVTATGLSLSGADAGNYKLAIGATATDLADISPKAITVTGITANNKTYDGYTTATLTTSGYLLHDVVSPDVVNLNAGSYIADFNNKNAGNDKPVIVSGLTLSGSASGNYTFDQPTDLIADILPKPLSITADNKVKTYDGLVYSPFTVSYNGFIPGETPSVLGGTLAFGGSAATATDIGSYTIIPGGQTSTNYDMTYYNGTLNINCAPVVSVRNNLNSGYGSLRNGMANVCDNGTVVFASGTDGQNIALTTGTIPVNKNVTFDNCTHTTGITISGSGDNFTINAGKSLTLSGCSKLTVNGNIRNNAGVGGVVLASGSSFIYNSCGLQATAKRLLNNGWHLLGSPFQQNTGATRANLVPAGGSLEMKPYTNGTGWGANITSALFFLQPTVGYAIKPNIPFTASLTGTLFCSSAISQPACEQTLSLLYNGTGTNQSWNLIANPYTSFLNWNMMGKTNVSTTLYLWDNTLNGGTPVTTTSYFRTYNSASNIGVPSGTKPYIAPMQGFFVKANNANPRLTFPLSARTHSSSAFYKEGSLTEILVRLRAENVMGTDELVVCKNPEAKNDFEEFDSEKMFDGQALEMYSQSAGGEKLVINTINATNTIIPLGLTGNTGAKTRITAYDLESGEQVYLEDRYKGKLISLSENTVYDFEFPTEMLTGRFFLRFGNISTPITSDVRVFEDNSQLNIIAQTGEDIQGVEVYTLTGACVYKVKAGNGNMYTGMLDLVPAMYLVRVQTSIATQNVKIIWK